MALDKAVNKLLEVALDAVEDGEKLKRDLESRKLSLFQADAPDEELAVGLFHGTRIAK